MLFPRGVPPTYGVPEVALDRLLDDAAQDFPNAIAMVHRGRRVTWRQLQDQADRFATALARDGIGRGSRVAVALPRTPQSVIALFAVWRLRATAVVCDADLDTDAIAATATSLECLAVVVEERRRGVADKVGTAARVIITGPEDVLPFPRNVTAAARRRVRRPQAAPERMMDLVRRHSPIPVAASAPSRTPTDVAAVLTIRGRPHFYTHRHLVTAAFHLRLWLPDMVAGSERILSTLAMHEPMGLTAVVTTPVLAAATTILVHGQDTRRISRAVERYDPTIMVIGAAPAASALLGRKARALRVCLQAGAGDPAQAAAVEQRSGARLRRWWAPGESAGLVTAEPVYGLTKPGTVGMPVTDTRVTVADAHGRALPPGQPGELWVDGPQLPSTGWLHTGIGAASDDDGFVTLAHDEPTAPHGAS